MYIWPQACVRGMLFLVIASLTFDSRWTPALSISNVTKGRACQYPPSHEQVTRQRVVDFPAYLGKTDSRALPESFSARSCCRRVDGLITMFGASWLQRIVELLQEDRAQDTMERKVPKCQPVGLKIQRICVVLAVHFSAGAVKPPSEFA